MRQCREQGVGLARGQGRGRVGARVRRRVGGKGGGRLGAIVVVRLRSRVGGRCRIRGIGQDKGMGECGRCRGRVGDRLRGRVKHNKRHHGFNIQ